MSMTSEFAPSGNALLLFKCELQEKRSKLTRAIGATHGDEKRLMGMFHARIHVL
jgi:hypothetical protein